MPSDSVAVREFRRRHDPDPARDLVEDLAEALAGSSDPGDRQAYFDSSIAAAARLTSGGPEYDRLAAELRSVAFPDVDPVPAGRRKLAISRSPLLAEVFEAIDGTEDPAVRTEIVQRAIRSGRFDGDGDALFALTLADPAVDLEASRQATGDVDAHTQAFDAARAAEISAVTKEPSPLTRMIAEAVTSATTAEEATDDAA